MAHTEPSVEQGAPNKTMERKFVIYAVGAGIGSIMLGIVLSSPRMFLGFVVGVICGVVGLIAGVYYLLNVAENKCLVDKNAEVLKRASQVMVEVPPSSNADHSGFLQVLSPSSRSPSQTWVWGDLKSNMLFYQDLKGVSKGVIALANCGMTVIKTKTGRLWRASNYIRLCNPDRAILGEFRECVLFFRNGKEMEEWYYSLKAASKLNRPEFLESHNAKRNHFQNLLRNIEFNWESSSIPNYRPPTVSALGQGGVSISSPSSPAGRPSDENSSPTSTNGHTHHSSSQWFNLLVHRIFYFLNDDPGFVGLVQKRIAAKLAKLKKPSMLKSLTLRAIHFGPSLPIVSNVAIRSADPSGSIRLDCDMEYHGSAYAELDIVIDVEILGKHIATIPASFVVYIKTIIGKMQVAFAPPPSDLMWLGFYTEPHIELKVDSFIGEKDRRFNLPDMAKIVVFKLQREIVKMMLLPEMDDWPLPHIHVPRGQIRQKHVTWEYQAGYVPPPKIHTEFDSTDSEDDDPTLLLSDEPPFHAHPFSSSSSSSSSSSQVPKVELKTKPTTATSSSSSRSNNPASDNGAKSLPPTPVFNQNPATVAHTSIFGPGNPKPSPIFIASGYSSKPSTSTTTSAPTSTKTATPSSSVALATPMANVATTASQSSQIVAPKLPDRPAAKVQTEASDTLGVVAPIPITPIAPKSLMEDPSVSQPALTSTVTVSSPPLLGPRVPSQVSTQDIQAEPLLQDSHKSQSLIVKADATPVIETVDEQPVVKLHKSSVLVSPPPLPPREKTKIETQGDPLTEDLTASGFEIVSSSPDTINDIFAETKNTSSSSSGFSAALAHSPPTLPPRRKSVPVPAASKDSFPKDLYADTRPAPSSSVSPPGSGKSMRDAIKSLFDRIVD